MVNLSTNSSPPFIYSLPPVLRLDANSRVCASMNLVFILTRIVLTLPFSIFILYLGHQRWRQHRSFKTMSHTDVFTFHFSLMELLWPLGTILLICGSYTEGPNILTLGFIVSSILFYGEGLFHLVTCVDRYLAVVHPITYLGLIRNRIRNISIGCVWLLGFTWSIATKSDLTLSNIPLYCYLTSSLAVISFCSLSALYVLNRPGLGEDRARVDKSKQRAFFTLMAILGVLWLWFVGFLVCSVLVKLQYHSETVSCLLQVCALWFNLPSTFILPLLYLHRSGKLCGCRYNRV